MEQLRRAVREAPPGFTMPWAIGSSLMRRTRDNTKPWVVCTCWRPLVSTIFIRYIHISVILQLESSICVRHRLTNEKSSDASLSFLPKQIIYRLFNSNIIKVEFSICPLFSPSDYISEKIKPAAPGPQSLLPNAFGPHYMLSFQMSISSTVVTSHQFCLSGCLSHRIPT